MAAEVVMPRLGWSMEEGTLVEWRKADGSPVAAGEVICVIESDKAEQEVESFDAGILRIPPESPPAGTRVPVGTLLAYVVRPGEPAPFERPRKPGVTAVAAPAPGAPAPVPAGRRDGPRSSAWSGRGWPGAAGRAASSSATSAGSARRRRPSARSAG